MSSPHSDDWMDDEQIEVYLRDVCGEMRAESDAKPVPPPLGLLPEPGTYTGKGDDAE